MKNFYHLLGNSLVISVINYTVWFAVTFYVYLQTQSVFATSLISGIYLITVALSGFWLGSFVDHYPKKQVMLYSTVFSLVLYLLGFIIYVTAPDGAFTYITSVRLWTLVPMLLFGVIAGNVRGIALPALVTVMVEEDRRDKANGLIGSAFGVSFMITSVISGLLVGWSGMYGVLVLAMGVTVAAIAHLVWLPISEKKLVHVDTGAPKNLDIKGTIRVIRKVPGLFPLIFFTTFNNFLGGVFMSLMDAYGLSLVSVQVWGLLWGVLSTGFIVGGLVIAKFGLGKNPLRALFLANAVIWTISIFFTIQPWIWLLVIGMYIYLCAAPYIEAAEHTIVQKVVPPDRQGRVFGFAQSVEMAASPLTALAIGPITQFIFIPFMTTGRGVDLIGGWFGTGSSRGIALVFVIAGIIGLTTTLIARNTKYYRELSKRYLEK